MSENLTGVLNIDIIGGYLCLDFANTVHSYRKPVASDELQSYTDLVLWSRRVGTLTGAQANALLALSLGPGEADAVLAEAKKLRRVIFDIFSAASEGHAPDAADLDRLRKRWVDAVRSGRLAETPDGYDWVWESGRDAIDGMLWPIVRSAIDLLTSDTLSKVRGCAAADCTWLFIDKSKNRSRRWCEMGSCGNRAKSRRHYQRTRSTSN